MHYSRDLYIKRHEQGIQLIEPTDKFCLPTVADLFEHNISIYFKKCDNAIVDVNSHNLYLFNALSLRDIQNKTIEKFSTDIHLVKKVHDNNRLVMETASLNYFSEAAVLLDGDHLKSVSVKMPWYNAENDIIGIFGFSLIIKNNALMSDNEAFTQIMNQLLTNKIHLPYDFSSREKEVIIYVLKGKTIREIAQILCLSPRTVEYYFENIKLKVGVNKRSELIEKLL